MQWTASPGMARQSLGIKLQKPTFVVELSFLLGVARFFVPGFSFASNTPIPYRSCDVLLTGAPRLCGM